MNDKNHIQVILRLVFKQEYGIGNALEDIINIIISNRISYFLKGFVVGSIIALLVINFNK